MVISPALLPTVVGVNVTLMVQLAPAGRLLPQVLVWAKAAPLATILVIFKIALPVLLRVTACALLGVPGD